MSKLEAWMEEALGHARNAEDAGDVPVGALLINDNRIIGIGWNERESTQRAWAHAEFLALENYHKTAQAWRVPLGTSLVVTCEPCLMCTGALIAARVENIYYGCRDSKGAALERIRPLIEQGVFDHKFKRIEGGVLADKCGEALSRFFSKKRAASKIESEVLKASSHF